MRKLKSLRRIKWVMAALTQMPGSSSYHHSAGTYIKTLGFRFSDIKILLATHAHFDHVGGMAAIKKIAGARLMIHEKDAALLADGGNSDYIFGGKGSIPKHS